jgi:hypothetical protein
MPKMKKSDITIMPEFFDRYINLVKEDDLMTALRQSRKDLDNIDMGLLNKIGMKVYAPGKWTINEIYQHILDNERIQAYRALRFARKDATPLPGYEENDLAAQSNANNRTLESIINELKVVRDSTILMYESFDKDALTYLGTANNIKNTALALGFVIVGHEVHHVNVIRERYLGL